jgi:hypothetical protein
VERLGAARFGALFVALSYRWLTREHPDPDGFHLGIVAAVLRLYFGGGNYPGAENSPLTAAYEAAGLDWKEASDCAVFWDFPSLHQPPRTAVHDRLFKAGLRASNIWYGHAKTVCWMQSELPDGFAGVPYEDSGWCFVEAAISAGVKAGGSRLDLGKRTREAMEYAYTHNGDNLANKLTSVCAGKRPPPFLPAEVKTLLETAKTFTNSSDTAVVAELYQRYFETVSGSATELVFREVHWGDDEAEKLVEALPAFTSVATLDLSSNEIGPRGAEALAAGVAVSGSLTSLNLWSNSIGDDGASAIGSALKESKVSQLKELSIGCNGIGPNGAKAIAAFCAVTTSATRLDVSWNNLDRGGNGVRLIREAVGGRSGFELVDGHNQ